MTTNDTQKVTPGVTGADIASGVVTTIGTVAVTAGMMVNKMGIGASILQFGLGFATYTKLIVASPIQGAFAQYACAMIANNMAAQAVAATFMGVSAGAIANVAVGVIAVATVAKVAEFGYNHIMANKQEGREPISIGVATVVKKAIFA